MDNHKMYTERRTQKAEAEALESVLSAIGVPAAAKDAFTVDATDTQIHEPVVVDGEYLEMDSPNAILSNDASSLIPLPIMDESIRENIEPNAPVFAQALTTASPDADMAVLRMNENYALIRSVGEIFRFSRCDFIRTSRFHIEHSNQLVEANVAGKLKLIKASDAWLQSPHRRSHDDIVYSPGMGPIVGESVNLWKGWGCERVAGDITPWRELMNFVFGDDIEHREWFEKWVAYPIQNPGHKLNTAVVLWSTRHGVGKTLMGQTISRIYGSKNSQEITSKELRSRFNGWAKSCQFVLGEENSGATRLTDSDRLKHLITGESIQIEEKFQPLLKIQNRLNFLFTSNHANAFYLESFDRRYFVWEIKGHPRPPSFYADFVEWRDHKGGIEALREHFCSMDLRDFDAKGHAPMTPAKEAMIDAGRSNLEQWLAQLRDDPSQASALVGSELVTLDALVEIYNLRTKDRAKHLEAGKALQRLGSCEKRRVQIGKGNRIVLHAISRYDHWNALDNPAWIEEAKKVLTPAVLVGLGSS
jgi:hypothetical protein